VHRVEAVTGADLSGTRVHTGAQSDAAARSISARAFAVGSHVHFAAGEYRPGSADGDRLLAHELAHAAQHSDGVPHARLELGAVGDAAEVEADAIADRATAGPCATCGGEGCQCGTKPTATISTARTVSRSVVRREGNPGAAPVPGAPSGPPAGSDTTGPAVPQPAGGAAPGTPGATVPGACPDPAEQQRKEDFRRRLDLHVDNNIPSTGIGKFDARYFPSAGLMPVSVKIHFDFVQADNTPGFSERMRRLLRGQSNAMFFWSDAEKSTYVSEFVARVTARWSNQHTIRSIKPCWTEFFAIPVVTPVQHADKGSAHFAVTVHKSAGPGIDYKSAVNNEHLLNPARQPTADFWQSDNREDPNFNSASVATTERQRLETALTTAAASPVQFAQGADNAPASRAALQAFAAAANQANPSAPMVPINIDGFASPEGNPADNTDLSRRRAEHVANVLRGTGMRQPLRVTPRGPVGAPNEAASRRVDVVVDTAFEATYASNRYSVSEHEFGHMLGNPDEYSNTTTGPLAGVQTRYDGLVSSAGLSAVTYGQNTSSQMSAGVDVLPRHYVTLWEALGRMTSPTLAQADWSLTA
jgi:outer membrane protein OmpA-like peptidoglycan-associated protein